MIKFILGMFVGGFIVLILIGALQGIKDMLIDILFFQNAVDKDQRVKNKTLMLIKKEIKIDNQLKKYHIEIIKRKGV